MFQLQGLTVHKVHTIKPYVSLWYAAANPLLYKLKWFTNLTTEQYFQLVIHPLLYVQSFLDLFPIIPLRRRLPQFLSVDHIVSVEFYFRGRRYFCAGHASLVADGSICFLPSIIHRKLSLAVKVWLC